MATEKDHAKAIRLGWFDNRYDFLPPEITEEILIRYAESHPQDPGWMAWPECPFTVMAEMDSPTLKWHYMIEPLGGGGGYRPGPLPVLTDEERALRYADNGGVVKVRDAVPPTPYEADEWMKTTNFVRLTPWTNVGYDECWVAGADLRTRVFE